MNNQQTPYQVRPWDVRDASQLLGLMKKLAAFEGYDAAFRVTRDDLLRHGLGPAALFDAYVAEQRSSGDLVGMAVAYTIPWTYDHRPTIVLKELFVDDCARGAGIGQALFQAVKDFAIARGASRLNWTVLAGNHRAEAFYETQGGKPDETWCPWTLPLTPA